MASNDYFYGEQQRPPPAGNTPSPAPYYNSQYAPSARSTPAPSYHSGYPANGPYNTPGPHGAPVNRPVATGPSPFDTVFDDNVYPMNSTPGHSTGDVSQQGLYHDTAYYGQGRASPETRPIAEDIPLQDRTGKDPDVELNDHIYDDPNGVRPKRRKDKTPKVGLGQLGMLGSDKKSIPWVCYIFTIAQIGVFIGEIAQNGKALHTAQM